MKFINETLYLEFSEMLDCGFSDKYLWKAKSTGTKCWEFIDDPADRRKVLVGYEKMKDQYKEKVIKRFGNPYEFIAKMPIRKLVETDFKADAFYHQYRFEGDKMLPIEHITKYTKAASWLNMLVKLNDDKKYIKKQLNLSLDQFWLNVCEIIKADKIDLPSSYRRLRNKMAEYQESGYESLIDWRFGNSNAAKVNDEVSEALLLEMIAHPNQHDDVIIANKYNLWAAENGYKTITAASVGVWRKANNYKLMAQRQGNAAWYDKYGKSIHRKRPSAPLLLVGSDDNDLDLYFMEITTEDGRTKRNPYHRRKLIVVMDAFNDYILGWADGDEVTVSLIRAAYLDAVYHIKELTGGWYLPHQIQTDRWGVDKNLSTPLAEFYKSMATYTPATVKVARGKYIERAFGNQWHQKLKEWLNYAGPNITSRGRLNPDHVNLVKRDFPMKEQAAFQIECFINEMRNLPVKGESTTRQQQWITAFQASDRSQEKVISEKKMLLLFGKPHIVPNHQYPEYPNKITKDGIIATINGREMVYDVPDQYYLQNVDKRVQLIWEPYNYKRVLVTDGNSLHFIATEFNYVPGALADFKAGDRTMLNTYLDEKRQHVEQIASERTKREKQRIQAEGYLQAGVMLKQVSHDATAIFHSTRSGTRELEQMKRENESWQQVQDEYHNNNISDLNKYVD